MHQDFMTSYFDLQLCFFITDISPLGCTLSDNFNGIFATSFLYYTFFVFISIFKRFPVLQEVEEGEKEELHIKVYMNIFFQRFILIPVTSGFSFFFSSSYMNSVFSLPPCSLSYCNYQSVTYSGSDFPSIFFELRLFSLSFNCHNFQCLLIVAVAVIILPYNYRDFFSNGYHVHYFSLQLLSFSLSLSIAAFAVSNNYTHFWYPL